MVPSASTPTTPAVTPDSTASMKRRRSSSVVLAPTSASRWLLSSEVMVLKVEPSTARSPSAGLTSTATSRLPSRDLLRRAHQLADRRHQAVGEPHADPDGGEQQRQRHGHIHEPEGHLHAGAALLEQLIFGDIGAGRAQLLQHLRVHRPDHIEIGVVEILERLDGADQRRLARRDHDRLALLGEVHGLLSAAAR